MSLHLPPRVRDLPRPAPEAVLWDFDGTLVDTEPVWQVEEARMVRELGGTVPEGLAEEVVGMSLLDGAAVLLRHADPEVAATTTPAQVVEALVERMATALASQPIPWRPGAEALLASLRADGVPTALVSASYRLLLDAVVDRLPEGSFTTVVAGDDVTHGKPHPEGYLAAAARLGVDPAYCLVLEDSATGAAAGNAAGCLVLAVPNIVAPPPAPRRIARDSLVGLDAAGLRALWESRAQA